MRRPLLAALLVAATAALPACDSDSPTNPPLMEGPVAWTVLLNNVQSALEAQTREVVRTDAALEASWDAILADTPNPDPLPLVDFTSEIVLVVGSGPQLSDCHSITVTSAVSDGADLEVTVTETGPTNDCACNDDESSPVEVVRIPRADQVSFVNVNRTVCNA